MREDKLLIVDPYPCTKLPFPPSLCPPRLAIITLSKSPFPSISFQTGPVSTTHIWSCACRSYCSSAARLGKARHLCPSAEHKGGSNIRLHKQRPTSTHHRSFNCSTERLRTSRTRNS